MRARTSGCRTHYAANLMSATPKTSWGWVKGLLHSIYDQPDAESVHAQFDRVVDALAEKLPKVADHLDQARADILAFTTFPKEIWRQIWSNNPISVNRSWDCGSNGVSGPTRRLWWLAGKVRR
jgi:putative transposase